MTVRPNPWISIPALATGGLTSWLGYAVTDFSCRSGDPSSGCPGLSTVVAVVCFVGAAVGMAVVLALAARSIAEYRDNPD
ncbi:MAG: hypothetical protein ACT4OP_08145 [Actinomycetota bacterium]